VQNRFRPTAPRDTSKLVAPKQYIAFSCTAAVFSIYICDRLFSFLEYDTSIVAHFRTSWAPLQHWWFNHNIMRRNKPQWCCTLC